MHAWLGEVFQVIVKSISMRIYDNYSINIKIRITQHSSLRIPIAPCPLPQNILLNLPRTRLGQLPYNFHLPRHHEPANMAMFFRPRNDLLA